MSQQDITQPKPASTTRKVFAAILDFFFIFIVAGFAIAQFSGGGAGAPPCHPSPRVIRGGAGGPGAAA